MSFVDAVQKSQVPHPTQNSFSRERWSEAFERLSQSEEDTRLHTSGLWVHSALSSLRQQLAQLRLGDLPKGRVEVAVGILNLLTETIVQKLGTPTGGSQPTMNLHGLAGIRRLESIVNASRLLLAQLGRPPFGHRNKDDIPSAIVHAIPLAMAYDWFEQTWLRVLWRGWYAEIADDAVTLYIGDRERERELFLARLREEDLKSQFGLSAHAWWNGLTQETRARSSGLPRVIDVVPQKGGRKVLKIGRDDGQQLSDELLIEMRAQSLYSPDLMADPLPKVEGLSLGDLLRAWRIVASTCHVVSARFPRPPNPEGIKAGALLPFAPCFRKRDIKAALSDALGFDEAAATAAVDLFTFSHSSREDVWQRPLIEGRDGRISLLCAAAKGPNLLRSIEAWARIGGSDLGERGDAFEVEIRSRLRAANRRKDSDVSPTALNLRVSDEEEEIDLLLRLGTHLFVGELKCGLHPSSPLEEANYLSRLETGAKQARRKADWISSHLGPLKAHQDFPFQRVQTVDAFVLSNLPLGTGMSFDGIPVTDPTALQLYLGPGEIQFALRSDAIESPLTLKLFNDDADAGRSLLPYLQEPPQLSMLTPLVHDERHTIEWADGEGRPIQLHSIRFRPTSFEEVEAHGRELIRSYRRPTHG